MEAESHFDAEGNTMALASAAGNIPEGLQSPKE